MQPATTRCCAMNWTSWPIRERWHMRQSVSAWWLGFWGKKGGKDCEQWLVNAFVPYCCWLSVF